MNITGSRIFQVVGSLAAIGVTTVIGAAPASADTPTSSYTITSGDGDTLRAIFYENADFTGHTIRYYGGSPCSTSTTDTDYSRSVVPPGWNDAISAVRDYNGCDVKLYNGGGFDTYYSYTGYVNYGSTGKYVGSVMNDRTSSFKVS
jgi:hypothetical protein